MSKEWHHLRIVKLSLETEISQENLCDRIVSMPSGHSSPHRCDGEAHIDVEYDERGVLVGGAPVDEEGGDGEQVEREADAGAPRHEPVDLAVLVLRVQRVAARHAAPFDPWKHED